MKFFYSCAFLIVLLAFCQASLIGLGSLKGSANSAVDYSKKIAGGLVKDIERVTSDLKTIKGKVTDINAVITNLVADSVAKLLENIFKVFKSAGNGISSLEESIQSAKNQVGDQLKKIFQDVAGESLDKIQVITGQAVGNKEELIKKVQDSVSDLVNNFLKSYDTAAEGVKDMKDKLLEKKDMISGQIKERVEKLIMEFVTKIKDLKGFGKTIAKKEAVEDLVNGISDLTSDVIGKLKIVLQEAKNIRDKIIETQTEKVREFMEKANNLMRSLPEKFAQAKEKLAEVQNALGDIMKKKLSSASVVIKQDFESALNAVNVAQDIIVTAAGKVLDLVTGTARSIGDYANGSFKGIFGGLTNIFLKVKNNIAKMTQDKLQNLGVKVIDKIKLVVNSIKDAGGNTVETKKNLIKDASEKVNSLVSSTIEQIKVAGSNIFQLEKISKAFTASMDKLIEEILKNAKIAAGGAKEISGNISESQKEIGSMVQEIIRQFFGDLTKNIGVGVDSVKAILGNIISLLPSSLISG